MTDMDGLRRNLGEVSMRMLDITSPEYVELVTNMSVALQAVIDYMAERDFSRSMIASVICGMAGGKVAE